MKNLKTRLNRLIVIMTIGHTVSFVCIDASERSFHPLPDFKLPAPMPQRTPQRANAIQRIPSDTYPLDIINNLEHPVIIEIKGTKSDTSIPAVLEIGKSTHYILKGSIFPVKVNVMYTPSYFYITTEKPHTRTKVGLPTQQNQTIAKIMINLENIASQGISLIRLQRDRDGAVAVHMGNKLSAEEGIPGSGYSNIPDEK